MEPSSQFASQLAIHRRDIFRCVMTWVPAQRIALEIYREVLTSLREKWDPNQLDPFDCWARRIAYDEVLKYRQTSPSARLLLNDTLLATLYDRQVASETLSPSTDLLQDAISHLNGRDQQLLEFRYGSQEPLSTMAVRRGCHEQTLCKALSRVRETLLESLQVYDLEQAIPSETISKFSNLVEGVLDHQQLEDLEAELLDSEAHQDAYLRFMALHGELLANQQLANAADEKEQSWGVSFRPDEVLREEDLGDVIQRRNAWLPVLVGCIGIGVLLVGTLIFTSPSLLGFIQNGMQTPTETPVPTAVASIASEFQCQWKGEAPGRIRVGDWLRLEQGLAKLDFDNGGRVWLKGPAELRIDSAGSVFLQSGRLNAIIPPSAKGFTARTPAMEVYDLGTEFGLVAGEDDEVQVFRGRVDAQVSLQAEDGSKRVQRARLKRGEAARVCVEDGRLEAGDIGAIAKTNLRMTSLLDADSCPEQDLTILPDVKRGARILVFAPPSVASDRLQDPQRVFVFRERRNVVLKENVEVHLEKPGKCVHLKGATSEVPAGTIVDVFLIHACPGKGQFKYKASLKLPGNVIGVIGRAEQLSATDRMLGAQHTRYQPVSDQRNLEKGDCIELAEDGCTLSLDWSVDNELDQIRVLVAVDRGETLAEN